MARFDSLWLPFRSARGSRRRRDGGRFGLAKLAGVFLVGALVTLVGCSSSSNSTPKDASATGATESSTADGQGKGGTKNDDAAAISTPLRVIVVDDPPLGEALARQWRTIADHPLEIEQLTSADVESTQRLPAADAILYPVGLLGTLAEREQIVMLPEGFWNGERLERRNLLELGRKREALWGEKPFAVPLGSQLPVLLYRADIFAKLGLKPPATWDELPGLVARLSTREELGNLAPAAGENWTGVLEPLGEGSAAETLLIRAAAGVRHRSQYSTLFDFVTMEPLIAGPPFVKALEQLVETHAMNPGTALEATRDSAVREWMAGRTALVIAWPSSAREVVSMGQSTPDSAATGETEAGTANAAGAGEEVRWAIAPLPGTASTYNASQKKWEPREADESPSIAVLGLTGRLGSVTRATRRGQAAANLLAMLSTAEWSVRVLSVSRGGGMSRVAHLETPDRWVEKELAGEPARQYADVVRETQRDSRALMVPRIPGRGRYLAALDAAVRSAVGGEQSAEEALQGAAETWRAITAELEVGKQKASYRKCLGVEP